MYTSKTLTSRGNESADTVRSTVKRRKKQRDV